MSTVTFAIPIAAAPAAGSIPETRVYSVDSRRPFTPKRIEEEFTRAVNAGFNVILFPVYINGFTLFPSQSARNPLYRRKPSAALQQKKFYSICPSYRGWDPVEHATSMAHSLGISFWGLARPYNFHRRYFTAPQKLLGRYPAWRIEPHPYLRRHSLAQWRDRERFVACPINPDYRRYLAEMLTDFILAYPVDGLVINYTGYGLRQGPLHDYPFCFCAFCRAGYEAEYKKNMVDDSLNSDGIARIRRWQIERSNESLEYLRHRLLKCRRTLRLVCRAQPEWRWTAEESGPDFQHPYCLDWNVLLETGLVEELLIDHDDETAPEMFRTRLVTDLACLHDDAMLMPSIQVNSVSDLQEPLEAIRRYPVAGFLAEFAKPITDDAAQKIHDLYFAQPASSPDHNPLLAAAFFLRRVQTNHRDNELIADFMRDLLRLIEIQVRKRLTFEPLQIIFENLAGLQAAIRRGRLGTYHIPESTMRDLGLARRIVRLACLDVRS